MDIESAPSRREERQSESLESLLEKISDAIKKLRRIESEAPVLDENIVLVLDRYGL